MASPPITPFTSHTGVTAAPFAVAVNVCVVPAWIASAAGLTMTPCVVVILTMAVPAKLAFAAGVAVTVILAGDGTDAGAVYKPVLPSIVPPPLTFQVNVVLVALGRNAVNFTIPLTGTLVDAG